MKYFLLGEQTNNDYLYIGEFNHNKLYIIFYYFKKWMEWIPVQDNIHKYKIIKEYDTFDEVLIDIPKLMLL